MKERDLYSRIKGLRRLTRSEAKVVDFFEQSHQRIVFETATSISQKAGVSKASVIRFLGRLGYGRFSEFQSQLRSDIENNLERPIERYLFQRNRIKKGEKDILHQSLFEIIRNLQKSYERIPLQAFHEAARIFALGKGQLFVSGHLSSFGLAFYFWYLASYLRNGVHLLHNIGSTLPNQLFHVTSKDVLFVITYRRYSRQTRTIAEHFAQRGARIIQLSDAEVTPISQYADITLVAPSNSEFVFHSATACLGVIESILSEMMTFLKRDIHRKFDVADGLFEKFISLTPSTDAVQSKKGSTSR